MFLKTCLLFLSVMGMSQNFLNGVRSSQFLEAWVGSAIYGLGLENFTQKSQLFQFFSLLVKKNLLGLGQKVPW